MNVRRVSSGGAGDGGCYDPTKGDRNGRSPNAQQPMLRYAVATFHSPYVALFQPLSTRRACTLPLPASLACRTHSHLCTPQSPHMPSCHSAHCTLYDKPQCSHVTPSDEQSTRCSLGSTLSPLTVRTAYVSMQEHTPLSHGHSYTRRLILIIAILQVVCCCLARTAHIGRLPPSSSPSPLAWSFHSPPHYYSMSGR